MSQLVDAEIKSAPANDLNNQNVGAGESQQPSAKAKTEAKTETSHLWRDILGMPASTPEEMQKKATLGEKPITTEAKVSQEALDIAKRTLLRIALRPESFNLIETTDSDLQALGQALGIESFWPKDQQQGQNNSSFLPWDNLTPEQKTKVLQEIEKRANKLFEDNPERAILIGLRSFDIIRGKIAQGIGFQELLPTTSQEELTPEEKKELQQLQNVPEIRDLIEGFEFSNCFRIAKNSDGTSDIVFDTDIFSKMTYEEYKLAYSGAKGKPIYSHLIKKRGWWIFEFGERSLNQEEFEEFKRKVLRKAEILHKKNDPKETTISIYKLTKKTGNNIDWDFIKEYLYLSEEGVLFSSDPKKADERNFALRVINNLIDDYLLVYNEVASVTGKPSITREQVLNADLEISQRDVKDIITGMQEETRKRLEEQASQEDSELVVKLIKGKLEEEKNRITQQKTETPSSVDSLTSIKERYQKIQRLIKERDFYRLDCDSELDSLLNSLPPELRDLIGGSDNFLRLLKGETLESIIGYKKINNYLYGDNADKNSPKEGTIAGRIKNIEEQIISLENKIIEITSGGGNRNTQNESIKSLQSLITSKRSQLEELKKQLNLTDYILDLLKISRIQGKRDINLESLPSSYSNLINFLKTEALIIQEENLFYSLCNESNIEIVKTDENGNKKRKKIEDIIREIENKSPEKTEIIMSQFEALQIAWGSKPENAWEVQSKMQARLEEVMKGKELEYNEEVWKGLGGEGENHKKAMQLVYILFGEDYLIIPELSDEKRKKIEQIKSLFVDGEFFGGLKLSELQIENNSELIKQLIEAWKRNVFGLRKIGEQPSQKIEQQPDQNNQQQPGGKAGGAASSP